MLTVKVGGRWLVGLRLTEDLSLTWRWPGDCFECSWTMQTDYGWRDGSLEAGKSVEVFDGANRIWLGELNTPDWGSGSFTARGLSQAAASIPAFDSGLNTTTTPATAVDTAIAQFGWNVIRDASVPTTPLTDDDTTDGINQINTILDAAADERGQRWGVDADGRLYFAADQTVPTWQIAPGVVELGQSNANYRSDIFVRYTRDTDATIVTERAQWSDGGATRTRYGFVSETVDVTTNLGPISQPRAAEIANGILSKCAPQPGWTDSVEVQHGEILTNGGEAAPLALIRAGHVVRLHGVYDDMAYSGSMPYLDVVLGEVKWTDGQQAISLSPVDSLRGDLASVIEDVAGSAA